MFWKKPKIDNEKLDDIGKLLLKSAALTDEEIQKAININHQASYNTLRANITKETLKRSEASDNWFAIWSIARYAVPLMTFLAIITLSTFWILDSHIQEVTTTNTNFSSYLPNEIELVPITACSISSKTECIVSSNDVISIVFQETREIKNEPSK
jgi:hypothetical protein